MGGPIFQEWGHQSLSGYFLLSWDNEGIGPPPLANLKPQSPYSGEHLRVSDIFLAYCYLLAFMLTLSKC